MHERLIHERQPLRLTSRTTDVKQIMTLQGEIFRSFSQGALVGFCEAIGEGAIAQITS